MISIKIVSDFVYQNFENVSVSRNNTHFHARCSLCGDSKKNKRKKRFHLDWKQGNPVFQCWNCGESGGFVRLYALIKGVSEEDAKKAIFAEVDPAKFEYSHTGGWVNSVVIEKTSDLPTFNEILDDCASESLHVKAFAWNEWVLFLNQFRLERKIPRNIELLYAWKGKYQGRIIIPVKDEHDNIIYFQARRRFDNDDSVIKYKNPDTEKSKIILNKHKFDREKNIIVTEGLIDAFMIGDQGTTMLGKELSQDAIDELFKLTKKHVILAFDNDEEGIKSLRKHIAELSHSRLLFFLMPKKFIDSKDINKVVVDHGISNVYDFIVENSHSKVKCNVLLGCSTGGR